MTICCITTSTNDATSTSIVDIKHESPSKLTPCSSTQNLSETTKTPEKSGIETVVWKCCWTKCSTQLINVDALYDHVIDVHIRPKLGGGVEDVVCCEWEDCEMEIERGVMKKKIEWLEQHFRTRHSRGARTYKCVIEGCVGRATTSRQLEEHVRIAHLMSPKKTRCTFRRSESSSNLNSTKSKTPVALTNLDYMEYVERKSETLWTDADSNIMIARNLMHWYDGLNVKYVKVENEAEPKLRGAAKRKTSYNRRWRPQYKLVPVDDEKPDEKVEKIPKLEIQKPVKEITLKDLFPRLYDDVEPSKSAIQSVVTPVVDVKIEVKEEEEDDFIVEKSLTPPPALAIMSPSGETSEDEEEPMPFLNRLDTMNNLKSEKKQTRRRRKSVEEVEEKEENEPLQKRQRRSLPYGVFEEDRSDNEDDYGYERIPEELLKQPTEIYIDASGVFKQRTDRKIIVQ